jgi:hypothetical protein
LRSELAFHLLLQDIEIFDLEDFKYNSVNITAFRLVDSEDARVVRTLDQIQRFQPVGYNILNKSRVIQVGTFTNRNQQTTINHNEIIICK